MSYTITNRDNSVTIPIIDGGLDTTTSLSLPGPNYVGYGGYLNENLVYILENFAGNSSPTGSLLGQLWYDKPNQTLRIYTPQGYQPVTGTVNSSIQPGPITGAVPKAGDFWFDQNNNQLYMYDSPAGSLPGNGTYKLIGPQYTSAQGVSGAIPSTIIETGGSGAQHNIIKIQFGAVTYAIFSKDSAFTPLSFDPGFPVINPGITFNSNITSAITTNLVGNVVGSVVGNLTGNVVATTLVGSLTGNVNSSYISATNFSSGNTQITGGAITGLTNLSATTLQATNFSSGNAQITSGNVLGLTNLFATTLQATNFSSGNAVITGGSIITATVAATTITGNLIGLHTGNVSGNVTGSFINATVSATSPNGTFGNLTSGNALLTGGAITGLTNLSATTLQATNISTGNAQITGGNISNTSGANVILFGSNIQSSVATTTAAANKTTAIATTAFVHSVMPTGIIVMWNSTAATIPIGWQLCDGSNLTPDLRDRFIVGASASGGYTPGAQGGNVTVTLDNTMIPSHSHTLSFSGESTSAGGHTHAVNLTDSGHAHTQNYGGGSTSPAGLTATSYSPIAPSGSVTGTATTGISVSMAAVADHTHTISFAGPTTTVGGGFPHENRPPYYALCYIQKMM